MSIKSSRLKDELASQQAADALNKLGWHMGFMTFARYYPHLDRFQIEKYQANRDAILRENAELYKANKGKARERHDQAALPLRIPELDWQVIEDSTKEITGLNFSKWPQEEKVKYMKNLYKERPEYRVG